MQKFVRGILQQTQSLIPKTPGCHILAYHLVNAGTASPVDISASIFADQMRALSDAGMVCSLQEAVQKFSDSKAIADTLAVITFDDAYENFYTEAWPIIQELQVPVTLYVPTHFIEGTAPPPMKGTDSLKACTWQQIQEMQGSGLLTVGSHSCTHRTLTFLDRESARLEIAESRKLLEDKLSTPVHSFCYPKGLWSPGLENLVRDTYSTAVIGGGVKINAGHWNPYRLSRLPVRRNMPADITYVVSHSMWLEERIANWVRPWIAKQN